MHRPKGPLKVIPEQGLLESSEDVFHLQKPGFRSYVDPLPMWPPVCTTQKGPSPSHESSAAELWPCTPGVCGYTPHTDGNVRELIFLRFKKSTMGLRGGNSGSLGKVNLSPREFRSFTAYWLKPQVLISDWILMEQPLAARLPWIWNNRKE